jgi:cytochrome c oxidase subunit 1
VWSSKRKQLHAHDPDPWDARTIEWTVASPTPEYNFAEIPMIHSRDDFWHQKYVEDEEGRLVRVPEDQIPRQPEPDHVHLPSPSYFPLVTALGLPIIMYGLMYNWIVAVLGLLVSLTGVYCWVLEPSTEPEHPGPTHGELEPAEVPA